MNPAGKTHSHFGGIAGGSQRKQRTTEKGKGVRGKKNGGTQGSML